jgi:hypothetical protein
LSISLGILALAVLQLFRPTQRRNWMLFKFASLYMMASSLLLALVSVIWVIERVFEVDAGIESIIDSAVLWPRSLYLAIAFTVAAAAFRAFEEKNDRLLPVGEVDDRSAVPDDAPVSV